MRPIISHASQLEEHSSWRLYLRGLKQLSILEAPNSVIQNYMFESAKYCFLAFADLMKGGSLKVADFHEIIASGFEDLANKRYHNLIVSCPPRSGKSMLASMFVAWLLGRDQETQHVIASYGLSLSNKFHKEVINMLKTPTFKKIFPDWKGFAKDSKFEMLSGGFILPTSVGGVLTGHTAGSTNIISPGVGAMVIDDPLKSSASSKAFESLQTWWQEEASTRKTNNYCRLIIATRFHANDLHGQVLETDGHYDEEENPEGWRWINIAGICEDPVNDPLGREIGQSHWPDNPAFSIEMLEAQRKTMGSSKFAALYQGTPTASEGQIVKAGWVVKLEEEKCPPLDVVWLGVDCAFSEKQGADETAVCVAGISTRDPRTVYIREIIKGRWGFPDLIASIKQLHSFYKPKVICIERAASGQSLIQMLKRETRIPVEEMKPLRSKTVRLEAVCPLLENDRIRLVDGEWTDTFIKELTGFPFVKHDDSVDAFVWALTYYAMKLDTIDRGVQNAIIQSRKWSSESRRPLLTDLGSRLESGKMGRGLPSLSMYNDLDSGSGLYGPDSFSRPRSSRGEVGYDLSL